MSIHSLQKMLIEHNDALYSYKVIGNIAIFANKQMIVRLEKPLKYFYP